MARAVAARDERRPLSIGVLGNAAELFPKLLEMKAPIDIVTDQTSAHDPLSYLPVGVAFDDWHDAADRDPAGFTKDAQASMAAHVRAMVEFQDAGAEVFDYGNSIRDEARKGGYDRAFEFPGFVPAYIRPLFCEGKGPFRWAALSGDPADIAATDRAILELFPDNERLHKWITMAGERVHYQGLPARICWLGYGERHLAGLKFNEMVASGELKAPIVIGRDHLDCGSVASPYRETEAMLDGSDAIADWALLNALVNTASGATWVSFHHGGGVGMGRSIHAGQVCVADGTELAAQKIERVLTNDPGMGVIRHVDAGYDRAVEVAAERGVRVPMPRPVVEEVARPVDEACEVSRPGHYATTSWTLRCQESAAVLVPVRVDGVVRVGVVLDSSSGRPVASVTVGSSGSAYVVPPPVSGAVVVGARAGSPRPGCRRRGRRGRRCGPGPRRGPPRPGRPAGPGRRPARPERPRHARPRRAQRLPRPRGAKPRRLPSTGRPLHAARSACSRLASVRRLPISATRRQPPLRR